MAVLHGTQRVDPYTADVAMGHKGWIALVLMLVIIYTVQGCVNKQLVIN